MPSRRVLRPSNVVTVIARAKVGRDCRSFRSFCRAGALQLNEPSAGRSSAIPVAGPECGCRRAEYCAPATVVTVIARAKVGRDCRSFRSFAGRARSNRPSRAPAAPAQSPSLGPNADAVAPSIAAQQRVTVKASPKVGRDCRSFRSFCLAGTLRSIEASASRSSAIPVAAGPSVDAVAPSIAAQQRSNGESTPQRGSRLPIILLILPGGQAPID
jgi:hypothetical protein